MTKLFAKEFGFKKLRGAVAITLHGFGLGCMIDAGRNARLSTHYDFVISIRLVWLDITFIACLCQCPPIPPEFEALQKMLREGPLTVIPNAPNSIN